MILISKTSEDGYTGLLTIYDMLDRITEQGEMLSHIGVIQLNHHDDIVREIFGSDQRGILNFGVGRR